VAAQFLDHGQALDRFLGGVVQDMDGDEAAKKVPQHGIYPVIMSVGLPSKAS
jgi:hypothetical protein